MIEDFKILHINNFSFALLISQYKNRFLYCAYIVVATRGNKYKLYQSSVKCDLRKHFFTNRVVSLWKFVYVVVNSDSINCFKSRLDKFWNIKWISFGIIKMFYLTGKPTLLGSGTEVYVHYKVLFKFT